MRKSSNEPSKFVNVATTVLEVLFEIILLPFHIAKAILNIIDELHK